MIFFSKTTNKTLQKQNKVYNLLFLNVTNFKIENQNNIYQISNSENFLDFLYFTIKENSLEQCLEILESILENNYFFDTENSKLIFGLIQYTKGLINMKIGNQEKYEFYLKVIKHLGYDLQGESFVKMKNFFKEI